MGYIYKITNAVNSKSYIGLSVNVPEKRRIREHLSGRGNRAIASAIEKYGKDVFTYEILEENVFPELLPELEIAYIAKFNTVAPNGYNLTTGGIKFTASQETKKKVSAGITGRKVSESTRKKMSLALTGKKHSAESRKKMSISMTGEKNPNYGKKHSVETLKKMSLAHVDRIVSSEARKNMSKAQKGRNVSAEQRRKFSEARVGTSQSDAKEYFRNLPSDMSLKEKRKLVRLKFGGLAKERTIYNWIHRWLSES